MQKRLAFNVNCGRTVLLPHDTREYFFVRLVFQHPRLRLRGQQNREPRVLRQHEIKQLQLHS
jgi:hypothetical protein